MGGHAILSCSILFIFIRLIPVNSTVSFNYEYDNGVYDVVCAYEHDDSQQYREKRFFIEAPWNQTESVFGQPLRDRLLNTVNGIPGAMFRSCDFGSNLCFKEYNLGKRYCKQYGEKAELAKLFYYQIEILLVRQFRHQDICILLHKFHGLLISVNTTRKF